MGDTAQERDWKAEYEAWHSIAYDMTLILVEAIPDFTYEGDERELAREAARRLRARQREEGDMIDALGGAGPMSPEAKRAMGKLLEQESTTPQREGEREPVAYSYRSTEIEWGNWHYISAGEATGDYSPDALRSHGYEVQPLYTEPPAEPDLDELTPRCPACEETMHDCECNPYMDTEDAESITMECSQCQAAVEVPIEGDLLRIGTHATGWTITRNGRIICPSHPASATSDTEEDDGDAT